MDVKPEVCRNWPEVTKAFDSFEPTKLGWDAEGDIDRKAWIFRGHKLATYKLEPSVERETSGKSLEFKSLESVMLDEFQKKARLHISFEDRPELQDKISWLALMQHYGVPTRLLDFTYSPYAALYFALRDRPRDKRMSPPEVWAIDVVRVNDVASQRSTKADQAYAKEHPEPDVKAASQRYARRHLFDQRFFATEYDVLEKEGQDWQSIVSKALEPEEIRRDYFNKNGLVISALPPVENHRLSESARRLSLKRSGESHFREFPCKDDERLQGLVSPHPVHKRNLA